MADNKKYYYMRLKEDFFDSDEMLVLESAPDGYLYSNILLKLYLRSLKNNGFLLLNGCIPLNAQMIATITKQPVGVVEKALVIYRNLGLIDVLDNGLIYMSNIELMIGESSSEGDRKRAARKGIEEGKIPEISSLNLIAGQMSDNRPPYIEIEKEKKIDIELDIDKEIEKPPAPKKEQKHKYGEYQHVLLTDTDRERLVNDYGEDATHKAIKYLDEYLETSGKKYKNHYLVMRKWVFDAVKQHATKPNNNRSVMDEWANA